MPRKKKTAYNQYMKTYMRDYRKDQAELLKKAKLQFGWERQKRRRK